ncbi:MAG: two-component system response regulator [Deltaproteobacteria bacterium HGW-Deltaproteobacteria-18]|nr:MAG: two-component system response regulator [Deltaproteobacteria bacterium HGW-Deltaproteobacteria-18]
MEEFSVLLVDDEEDFLRTIIKRLAKRGLKVQGASRGEQALAMLAEEPRDVVVLDVKMPGMDGLEVLRRIKADWPSTEVIMLTGHASIDAAMEGMNRGAFDYLMKPADLEDLLYKLEDAYRKKSINDSRQAASTTNSDPA